MRYHQVSLYTVMSTASNSNSQKAAAKEMPHHLSNRKPYRRKTKKPLNTHKHNSKAAPTGIKKTARNNSTQEQLGFNACLRNQAKLESN